MTTVYLASPLGFSPELKSYRNRIKLHLRRIGCETFDPWHNPFGPILKKAKAIPQAQERAAALADVARKIGHMNETHIRECDLVLGVLDGVELDSGTVCEIGYGAALGKKCYGLRTDFRDVGDLDGLPFNLQVLYFIEASGGQLFRKIKDIQF